MKNVTIIGNPNTGKSTLFNSMTKSNVHTGNWHGVTVDASEKMVSLSGVKYRCTDLPGLYSTNPFSLEEKTSLDYILSHKDDYYIYVLDANSLRRNLYLLVQLSALRLHITLLINNYDMFLASGGKIDAKRLANALQLPVIISNASKQKLSLKLISETKATPLLADNELGGSEDIYALIDRIYADCVKAPYQFVYGKSKLDRLLLNKWLFLPIFFISMFAIIYLTFFTFGQTLSNYFIWLVQHAIEMPILSILGHMVKLNWLKELIEGGVFASLNSVLSFLVPVCILNIFLGLIEDSGIMSRIAFNLDDFLNTVGLNGKSAYTLLLGLGCNTTAIMTAKSISNRNVQIKTALLTPYISCAAKLPIYSVIACSRQNALFEHA